MTGSEKVICKAYLEDLDKNRLCSEYKLLMELLEQKPCEDCISREDALMCLTGEYLADKEYPPEEIISKHIKRIKALPPVQPVRRKGKWIPGQTIGDGYFCSNCKRQYKIFPMEYKFCPSCGAAMKEGEKDEPNTEKN